MLPSELIVLLDGQRVGIVRRAGGDRLSLVYDEEWRQSQTAYPLSHSMPLFKREHQDAEVRAYLEGLLPDNPEVLSSWGKQFHVSGRNAYGLLAHVGEDCPGAVQFTSADRANKPATGRHVDTVWLSDAEIAERLRKVIQLYDTGAPVRGGGYFSLAGAQPKIVLYGEKGRWAEPSDVLASTHILKPPAQSLEQFALNEHLCMVLAQELQLRVAHSKIHYFEDQVAIVVERFDRVSDGRRVRRIHQEDLCQALAVRPASKYESEGGPGAPECGRLILQASDAPDDDLGLFVDALALNWIILGTDAHAKNFALLYEAPRPRLAPLYDIISLLPYPRYIHPSRAKLAMRVGTEYRVNWVRRRHWEALARAMEIDEGPVVDRVRALVEDTRGAIERTREIAMVDGLDEEFSSRLLDLVHAQLDKRLRALEEG